MKYWLLLSFLAITPSFAEEAESGEQDAEQAIHGTVPQLTSRGRLVGELQIRPSYGYGIGATKAENIANLGVMLGPNTIVDYTQFFNIIVADPSGKTVQSVVGDDGFLRAKFQKVWQNVAKDLTFDYEARFYVPTHPVRQGAGMITSMRNIFSLTKRLSPTFALTLQEIPILHAYGPSGTGADQGASKAMANPIFENRVYLIPSWDITPKLNFALPILFWGTRYRAYNSLARNNDKWGGYTLMIWPELTLQVAEKTWIGVSYYTENLINDDLSGTNFIGDQGGFASGTGQLVFRQTL